MQEPLSASASALIEHINNLDQNPQSLYLLAESTAGYSLASYYTSLGLFVISVPGLWSLIKRSVKSKVYETFSYFKLLFNDILTGCFSQIEVSYGVHFIIVADSAKDIYRRRGK